MIGPLVLLYSIACIDPPASPKFQVPAVCPEVVLFLAADACCLNQPLLAAAVA